MSLPKDRKIDCSFWESIWEGNVKDLPKKVKYLKIWEIELMYGYAHLRTVPHLAKMFGKTEKTIKGKVSEINKLLR